MPSEERRAVSFEQAEHDDAIAVTSAGESAEDDLEDEDEDAEGEGDGETEEDEDSDDEESEDVSEYGDERSGVSDDATGKGEQRASIASEGGSAINQFVFPPREKGTGGTMPQPDLRRKSSALKREGIASFDNHGSGALSGATSDRRLSLSSGGGVFQPARIPPSQHGAMHFTRVNSGSVDEQGRRMSSSVVPDSGVPSELVWALRRQERLPGCTGDQDDVDRDLLRIIAHNLQLRGLTDSLMALKRSAADMGIDLMHRGELSLAGAVRAKEGTRSRMVVTSVTGSELQTRVSDAIDAGVSMIVEGAGWPTKLWHRETIPLIASGDGGIPPGYGTEKDRKALRNHVSIYRLIDCLVLDKDNAADLPLASPIRKPNFTNIFFIMHTQFITPPQLFTLFVRYFNAVEASYSLGRVSRQKTQQVKLRILRLVRGWMRSFITDWTSELLNTAVEWASEVCEKVAYHEDPSTTELSHAAMQLSNDLQCALNEPLPRVAVQERLRVAEHDAPPPRVQIKEKVALSNLASLDEQEVARQLCLLSFEHFSNINSREFFNCAWMASTQDLYALAINLRHLCGAEGRLCSYSLWVAAQIIKPERKEERRDVFKRCVRIAHACLKLRNYAAARALYAGLTHRCVRRMRNTVFGEYDTPPLSTPGQQSPTPEEFCAKGIFEACDDTGTWWPVTIEGDAGGAHWSCYVHDDKPGRASRRITTWPRVSEKNIRRLPQNAKKCGDILSGQGNVGQGILSDKEMFMALESFANPFKQAELRKMVDEELETDNPCVPDLSPYMHDFTILNEQNSITTVPATQGSSKCIMVHWGKLGKFGETLLRIIAMQRRPYNFVPLPPIQQLLTDLPGLLDEEALEKESLLREPPLPVKRIPRAAAPSSQAVEEGAISASTTQKKGGGRFKRFFRFSKKGEKEDE